MAVPCDKHCEGKCRVLPKHRGSQGMLPGRGDVKTENWRHRQRGRAFQRGRDSGSGRGPGSVDACW